MDEILSFTLKGAIGFGILGAERRRGEVKMAAITTRNAVNADKKVFKEFLVELSDDGN